VLRKFFAQDLRKTVVNKNGTLEKFGRDNDKNNQAKCHDLRKKWIDRPMFLNYFINTRNHPLAVFAGNNVKYLIRMESDMKNSRQGMETINYHLFFANPSFLSDMKNSRQGMETCCRSNFAGPASEKIRSDMKNSRQGMETFCLRVPEVLLPGVRHEEFPSGNGNRLFPLHNLSSSTGQT